MGREPRYSCRAAACGGLARPARQVAGDKSRSSEVGFLARAEGIGVPMVQRPMLWAKAAVASRASPASSPPPRSVMNSRRLMSDMGACSPRRRFA
jgi:hypothetical protein